MRAALPPASPAPFLEKQAAFGFDAAHQGIENQDRAALVNFVGVTGAAVAEMKYHRRFVPAHLSGQAHDLISRDAGLLCRPFRRVRPDKILQVGKAVDPAVDVSGIVQAFFQNHVNQGIVQGQVGSRPDHPVTVGLGRRDGDPGVDVGQLGPVFQGTHQVVDLFDRDGLEDIAAVKDDVLGVLVIDPDLTIGEPEQ